MYSGYKLLIDNLREWMYWLGIRGVRQRQRFWSRLGGSHINTAPWVYYLSLGYESTWTGKSWDVGEEYWEDEGCDRV
jgi:hypothetical protein